MSYRDYPRIWKTAYYLLADDGAQAVPLGQILTSGGKGGGRAWQEWAIDLRRIPPERSIEALDAFYLRPSNEYQRVPYAIKLTVKRLWKEAHKRGLVARGLYIVEEVHG